VSPHSRQQIDELASYSPNTRLLKKVLERPLVASTQVVLDDIAGRLFERIDLLKDSPSRVLDLGCSDGRHMSQLAGRFPKADVIGADLSSARLCKAAKRRRFWQKQPLLVCLDAASALPFEDASFDLLLANMLLPWVFDAEHLMTEINRVVTTGGAFFISTAGPDTLVELRDAWASIDDCVHINAFLDMHDLGDLLVAAGIADPVLDTERVTVTYPSLDALLKELVGLGFINVLGGRRRGLTSAGVINRLAEIYPVNEDGGINATLELVVAHGWAAGPRVASSGTDEFYFSVDQLKSRS